jgi:hypothetical protein
MRGHSVGQIEIDLVDITPAPAFGRVITLDDRVAGRVEMLGRVAIGGIVATPDVAAGATDAQMDPPGPGLEAFLAPIGARRDIRDRRIMRARIGHGAEGSLTRRLVNG